MVVMIEVSHHTIVQLWDRARWLLKGNSHDHAIAAGIREALHALGEREKEVKSDD